MSKLDDLILKQCPKGVEYKELGQITLSIRTGLNPRQNFMLNTPKSNLNYVTVKEFVSGKVIFSKNTDKITEEAKNIINKRSLLEKDDVLFSGIGTIGKVALVDINTSDWDVSESVFLLKPDQSQIYPKFLKYVLESDFVKHQYENSSVGSTLKGVRMSTLSKITIPIPPLEVQQEIVRILDTFTTLEAELEAELEARKKQYEWYRRGLFGHNENLTYSTLGSISTRTYSGSTPLANSPDYYGGEIPWLRTQEVRFNRIYDTEMRITEKALKETSVKWIPENCVIIAISGATAGRSAINKIPLTTNQHCCCLEIDQKLANYRYVFHWVSSQYEKLKSLGQGARSDLNSSIIKGYPIPLVEIREQERIADILDSFDILVNDISNGLPAEITARRKQYEYYRNKLLTFKEVNHDPV